MQDVTHDVQGHIGNKLLRFSHLVGDGSFRKKVQRVLAIKLWPKKDFYLFITWPFLVLEKNCMLAKIIGVCYMNFF